MQTELEKVKRKIDDAKFQVSKFVEQHYLDFDPLLVHSRELVETSSKLSEEVEELVAKAETEVSPYCINFYHNLKNLSIQQTFSDLYLQLKFQIDKLNK